MILPQTLPSGGSVDESRPNTSNNAIFDDDIFEKMGFVDSLLGVIGCAIGIPLGLVLGFFVFVYLGSKDAGEGVVTRSLDELDSSSIIDLFPDLPLWVMGPDYERVDWFNKYVHYVWPYLDKAVCGIIESSAKATFAEYIGKYCIRSLYFERLTLGEFPPSIHGLKAQDSNENELVLDLSMRWAGNSNIALTIKLLALQFSIQLVDVQMSAAIRIVLKPFVPTFPCFSRIGVSLMEKPKIDFGLKILRGDIMSIPGLYHLVQEVIAKQSAKLFMWPQTYSIDLLDDSIGAAKKPVGILHVKVVRACNLLKMDFIGTSDPYVELSLTGEKLPSKKTTVVRNNLNPTWNEEFKLIVKEPEFQALRLVLYDWEKVGAHDYLGMQVLPLSMLTPYEKKLFTLALLNSMDVHDPHNKKSRGKIIVELTFVPFLEDSKKFNGMVDVGGYQSSRNFQYDDMPLSGTGLLLINIIEAEDVEGKYQSYPCATVIFQGEKRQTKSVKKTRDPCWNEEFQFVLDKAPVRDKLEVEVVSRRRRLGFMTKESLGYIDINLADVVYNGHINKKYSLINSKHGIIHLDIRWKVI